MSYWVQRYDDGARFGTRIMAGGFDSLDDAVDAARVYSLGDPHRAYRVCCDSPGERPLTLAIAGYVIER